MGVVSDFLGLSSTTGAFAAGVLLAESGYRAQIEVSWLLLMATTMSFVVAML
jgi:Kef-type K+ transport system membrane component KefB